MCNIYLDPILNVTIVGIFGTALCLRCTTLGGESASLSLSKKVGLFFPHPHGQVNGSKKCAEMAVRGS